MTDYRKKLTLETIGGVRTLILQCNKSERKSVVRHHTPDGSKSWMKDKVASQHPDGTPKHLHIALANEGVYEVIGQPQLSGFYAFYNGVRGTLYYAPISQAEGQQVLTAVRNGSSHRDALVALGKSLF